MIDRKRVLGLIPARGNSKSIIDKNIKDLYGKPLIAHTIEHSLNCPYIDKTIVTTDSTVIRDIALEWGAEAPFLRPPELATDASITATAVYHAIKTLEGMGEPFDILVLLQPTSPLRTAEDINGALERFIEAGGRGLAAVSLADNPPLLMRTLDDEGYSMTKLVDLPSTVRRQDMPDYYMVNGSLYINNTDEITEDFSFNDNEIYYKVEKTHGLDINEPLDLLIAAFYGENRDAEQAAKRG